jgi:hypothetical protein
MVSCCLSYNATEDNAFFLLCGTNYIQIPQPKIQGKGNRKKFSQFASNMGRIFF